MFTVKKIVSSKEPTDAQKLKAFGEVCAMVATLAPFAPEAFRLGAEALLARLRPPVERPAELEPENIRKLSRRSLRPRASVLRYFSGFTAGRQ